MLSALIENILRLVAAACFVGCASECGADSYDCQEVTAPKNCSDKEFHKFPSEGEMKSFTKWSPWRIESLKQGEPNWCNSKEEKKFPQIADVSASFVPPVDLSSLVVERTNTSERIVASKNQEDEKGVAAHQRRRRKEIQEAERIGSANLRGAQRGKSGCGLWRKENFRLVDWTWLNYRTGSFTHMNRYRSMTDQHAMLTTFLKWREKFRKSK